MEVWILNFRNVQWIGAALLLALGGSLLPLGTADAAPYIRKPELNRPATQDRKYQPLAVDAEGGSYALDLTGPAWIWLRLSPDSPESTQAASVIIRCRQYFRKGEAGKGTFSLQDMTVLRHYYLCPRLGTMQQLNEVHIDSDGHKKIVLQRDYDPNQWFKPEAGSAEEQILRYAPEYLDPKYAGREMTVAAVDEVRELAAQAKEGLWAKAAEMNREPKLYLHWTAGSYGRFYCSYHINIDQDGTIYLSTTDFAEPTAGTWLRNSGAVNLTIAGCKGSSPKTLGPEPPTKAQIETLARVIAALSDGIGIPVDKQHVLTHGEAANNEDGLQLHQPYPWWNDSYGDHDTRGDLEYLGTKESPAYAPTDPKKQEQRGGSVLRAMARTYQASR